MDFATNFTPLDWGIVVCYLLGTVLLGMYVNRHIHGDADYLVGGRASGTALSVATLVGTELGLVTLMYNALEGFNKGFAYLVVPLISMLAVGLLGATGIGIGQLRRLRLTTIPEYFERRYSRGVRIAGGTLCAVAGILNMGLFPKMGAIFITYATGLKELVDEENVVLLVNGVTSLLIVLVVGYTVLGGMVAVIVTDYVQFVVLSLGLGLGLAYCFASTDLGWPSMVAAWSAKSAEPQTFFDPTRTYGWTYIILQFLVAGAAALCWAPSASRALTTKDEATTRRTYFFASTGMFARVAIPLLWGAAAYAYFSARSASFEVLQAEPGWPAQAMPLLLGKLLPTGLLGILVAGLLAAFMSTHDSYLLAWGSVISRDIVGPLSSRGELTSQQSIDVTRISVVLIGVFLLIFGIWTELPASVWDYMAVTGTIYISGAATALLGGIYWKKASTAGAIAALCGGLVAILALFVEPLQEFVADAAGADTAAIAEWLNAYTIGVATYAMCLLQFVIFSLLIPDQKVPQAAEVSA